MCKVFFSLFFARMLASDVKEPAADTSSAGKRSDVAQCREDVITTTSRSGITISYTSILSVNPVLSMEKNASTL